MRSQQNTHVITYFPNLKIEIALELHLHYHSSVESIRLVSMTCFTCDYPSRPSLLDADINRIAAFRTTNQNPNAQEKHEFSEMLHSSKERALALPVMIAQLQSKLADLAREQRRVDALVSDLSVILHPIRAIPQEILSEILSAVALNWPPQSIYVDKFPRLDSLHKSAPSWVLSKVSSNWRSAALATGSLWDTITLFLADKETKSGGLSSFFLLSTFLARSGNKKLSVHLHSGRQYADISSHPLIPTLLMTCQRWQHAAVSLPYATFDIFARCPAPFTCLVSLYLDVQDTIAIGVDVKHPSFFNNMPALRSLTITEPIVLSYLGIPPSLHHYTHIRRVLDTFDRHNQEANTQLVSRARSLQSATFVVPNYSEELFPSGPYLLPDLHTLSLSGSADGIRNLCNRIRTPTLKRLFIRHDDRLDIVFAASQTTDSLKNVTNLNIHLTFADKHEAIILETTLKQMPQVSDLTIGFSPGLKDVSEVFNVLNAKLTPGVALALQTLKLMGRDFVLHNSMAEMMRSRRSDVEGVSVLKRVSIDHTAGKPGMITFDEQE